MSKSSQIHARGGVIAAGDPQTADAGAEILRMGGNAFDAAVAASFAAFVCEVALCGPLGGGVMVARHPDGVKTAMDFFARSPGVGVAPPEVLDFGEATIDFGVARQTFRVGRGAAAVGLALSGLLDIHRRWGKLPLHVVAAPAVALGRAGYEVGGPMSYILSLIAPIFAWTSESKALCYLDDRLPQPGERMFNGQLADVIEAIAAQPTQLQGLYAQLAREFGPANGGLISSTDLAEMKPSLMAPVDIKLGEWSVLTMPSPSVGGALIAVGLKCMQGLADECGFFSEKHLLRVAETQRILLALRAGDFDLKITDSAVVDELLSDESISKLRETMRTGDAPEPSHPIGSTTQISVIDADSAAVSLTLTNGEGCGYVLHGTGIEVNNLLGEADINPRGFHVLNPGQAMMTMMAPTLAFKGDSSCLSLGSGGSNRLRNAIMQTLSHVIEYGCAVQDAVLAPRLHVESHADGLELNIESDPLIEPHLNRLAELFPKQVLFPERNMFFGGVHTACLKGGHFTGVGDPRRGGCVAFGHR